MKPESTSAEKALTNRESAETAKGLEGWGFLFAIALCWCRPRLLCGDTKRPQEGAIAAGEGASLRLGLLLGRSGFGIALDLIQADGGLEHEKDIKALLANLADDT
ncbi:MAG: hypothetical protein ACLGQX_12250 [Acidobacteriota bacterium]